MGSNKKGSDNQKVENLLAVVITDSFDEKFGILTEDQPKCLLPLANKALLDYTLEFLDSSRVQEAYVYCAKFAPEVKQHLALQQWTGSSTEGKQHTKQRSKMNISVIANEECQTFGDAMRDLDGKGLLRDHFVLTHGDVVSNINLEFLLEEHKKRCTGDKDTTMTLVYKHLDPGHHCRTKDQELLLVTGSESNKIVYHARAEGAFNVGGKDKKNVNIPAELFQGNSEEPMAIRFDLMDTGIAICAPSVPLQFADNFDCQSLDQFIKGCIQDDLSDHSLYASIVDDNQQDRGGYAARVVDFLTYMSVTSDVLNRWVYPIVPERNRNLGGRGRYTLGRHNIYKVS